MSYPTILENDSLSGKQTRLELQVCCCFSLSTTLLLQSFCFCRRIWPSLFSEICLHLSVAWAWKKKEGPSRWNKPTIYELVFNRKRWGISFRLIAQLHSAPNEIPPVHFLMFCIILYNTGMECKYSTDLLPFFCGNADPFMECVCAAVFFLMIRRLLLLV